MRNSEKTRDELIHELNDLRDRLRLIRRRQRSKGSPHRDPVAHAKQMRPLQIEGTGTDSIDLTGLFRAHVTSSGSFDIGGEIWSTTFGKVLQAVPIPSLLVDQSYKVTAANEACGRMSREYQSIIGSPFRNMFASPLGAKRIQALIEDVFADRKPRMEEAVLKIGRATMLGRMTLRSIRIMNERLLLVLIEDLTGEKLQLLVNQKQEELLRREIAERQLTQNALEESEIRFRQMYESAPVMMQTVDPQGIIRNVNSKWLEELGFTRDEAVGQSIGTLFGMEVEETILSVLNGFQGRKEIHDLGLRCAKKDGQLMEVLFDAVVIEDRKWGTVALSTMRDVTRQTVLEHELREAQKMQAVGTLAGGIAHDFNNLLQIILGFADLLRMKTDRAAPEYSAISAIHEAAHRGAELVNQIMAFSRKVPTNLRAVDLTLVVKESKKLLSRTIPKMVHIDLQLQEGLRPILADSGQIEQLLMNLLINAKDAMPKGGQVTISTRHVTLDEHYCRSYPTIPPGDYVALIVSDNGHGMEKEVVDRIFEPFFTTKKQGEGTGLGLAIVFGIVKSHGGHIVCRSHQGVGTAFELYFPPMDVDADVDLASSAEFQAFGTERVLLVDDEELIRNWGSEVLGKAGYTVLVAANGEAALEIYQGDQGAVDLVILDLVMPGMGGKQCLEKMLKTDPKAKVLITSGYLIDQQTMAFLERRARGIVKKPFKVSELLRAVRGVLDKNWLM